MKTVTHVSQQTFRHEVLQSPVPVLVDFYADWCGPCRMLAPTLERLATEFTGRAKIVKVNIDREPGLADQFQVSSIPTLVLLVDGRVAGRTTGLVGEAGLRQALNQLVGSAASPQYVR
ncbi:MAG: thioredoxin [Planctomycetaceae bacterium]|nr:thioredoxin [Planctomycetaceae bacterium]